MKPNQEQIIFAILITTKNRCDELRFTLDKIHSLISRNEVECVVFDDGSDDETSAMVTRNFPEITLLRNESSKGLIYCRNKMLNTTTAEYSISLDDDAHFLSENPLEIIASHFDKNPNCGVIAFRIFWSKSKPQNSVTDQQQSRVRGFVGCGHAWKMSVWNKIQNYPEWFEFYGEEDFAGKQLSKKNYTIDYLPEILIQHRVDLKTRAIRDKDGEIRYRRSLRAGWYLYFLFYPAQKIPRKMAYSFAMQFKNKIFNGNFKIIIPLFKAIGDVIVHFPRLLRERNAFTDKEYEQYMALPETKVYWNPEK